MASAARVEWRNVVEKGFPAALSGMVDGVFLDLPSPWLVAGAAARALLPGRPLVSYSPCIEQVQAMCAELDRLGFTRIETQEVLLQPVRVAPHHFDGVPGPIIEDEDKDGGHDRSVFVESATPDFITARPSGTARGHTAFLTVAQAPPTLEGVEITSPPLSA